MIKSWKNKKLGSLKGKRIVITGTTSGLGFETLKHLVSLSCEIAVGVRNTARAAFQVEEILKKFPFAKIQVFKLDLTNIDSILNFAKEIKTYFCDGFDALINNAGIFAQPKEVLSSGYEKHFFTNTIAPIILTKELLPLLQKQPDSKVVFLGSISFNKSKTDFSSIDKLAEKNNIVTYANSKRWLTFYAIELAQKLKEEGSFTSVTVCNPGISGTSLLSPKNGNFSKLKFKVTDIGQKLLFPSPKKASLTELASIIAKTEDFEWISPSLFGIWGYPKISRLKIKHLEPCEIKDCYNTVEEITSKLLNVKK